MSIREFFHSNVEYAFAYTDVQLSCAVLNEGTEVPDIRLSVERESAFADNIRMETYGSQNIGEKSYTVYTAVIPASMVGSFGTLQYAISVDGEKKVQNVISVRSKDLPKIIISEFYARPRGHMISQFIELTNISNETVDLYDYKFMYYADHRKASDAPIEENYFSDTVGECIICPHESAIVRFLTPDAHKIGGGEFADSEGLCKILNSEYGYENLCLSPEKVKIFNPEISVQREDGTWTFKPHAFEIPNSLKKYTFLLVPRAGSFDDAVFELRVNADGEKFEWDYPVKASSLWWIDPANAQSAVKIAYKARVTPGYLDQRQIIPDFEDIFPPLIIPNTSKRSAYLKDGDLTVDFAVVDKRKVNAYLTYLDENGEPKTLEAKETANCGIYSVCVPGESLARLKRFDYYITAKDSLRTVFSGSKSEPLVINLYDNVGPSLESISPSEASVFEYEDANGRVTVKGTYFDVSGINISKCILCLDKKDCSGKTVWSAEGFSFTTGKLKKGKHTVELALFDMLGNSSYHKISFRLESTELLGAYHGEVHCHTGVSDGCGTTSDALTYARDVGKVDFFAVTDHSHYFSDEAYAEQIEAADSFDDPGHFTALYGYEMTWNIGNGYWGHMNVINSKKSVHDIDKVSMPEFFDVLKREPDVIAMFNHPGYAWGNFEEFGYYSPEIDRKICLSEIKGKGYDREYANLLTKGWHATPSFNEDNHAPNWTCATPSTTYVLSPALTRYNILDSIRKRRTYTTTDPTMKLYFKINDKWLGSVLKDPKTLNVYLKVITESEEGIGNISLIGEDNIVVESINVGLRKSYVWKLTIPAEYDYYYIRITSSEKYTVTAPVWIEGHKGLQINSIENGLSAYVDKPNALTVKLENTSDFAVDNIRADFYLTDASGFDYERTEPYYTTYIKKMMPHENTEIKACAPNVRKHRRLSVRIKGFVGKNSSKVPTSATSFVMLTPVIIAGVLPSSSKYTFTDSEGKLVECHNPFPYITLYNTTHSEISLDNFTLRNWIKTGKAPTDASSAKLAGMVIPPHSSVVIWVKNPNSELTVNDFNARYGTSFAEGENFRSVTSKLVERGSESHRIELLIGDEVVSRARYNFGLNVVDGDIMVDKEIIYRYIPNITSTLEMVSNKESHSPGSVECDQKPPKSFGYLPEKDVRGEKKLSKAFIKSEQKSGCAPTRKTDSGKSSIVKTALGMLGAAAVGAVATVIAVKASDRSKSKASANSADQTVKNASTLALPVAGAIAALLPGKTETKTGVKIRESGKSLKTVTKTVTTTKAKKSDLVKAAASDSKKPKCKKKQSKKAAEERTVKQVKKEIKKAVADNKKGKLADTPSLPTEGKIK